MNNKWLTKLIIFVFLLSTFSNSALVVTPAFAETGNEDVTEVAYEQGIHKLPIEILDANTDEKLEVNDNVKDNQAEVEVSNDQLKVFLTLTEVDSIPSFKVEQNGKLVEAEEVLKKEEENTDYVSFSVDSLNEATKGEVEVVTEDGTESIPIRIQLEASEIPLVEVEEEPKQEKSESTESKKEESPEGIAEEDVSEDSTKSDSEDTDKVGGKDKKPNDTADSNKDEKDKEESLKEDKTDQENDSAEKVAKEETEKEDKEPTPAEKLEDGAYELSYTTEGANIGGFYEGKATVIVDGDKQYLQLQGKSMRQFVEYLYLDGKRMEISEATNEGGAYIAQIELSKKVEKNEPLAFVMVINARGNIMSHATEITLDFDEVKELDSSELIEGVPTEENNTFIKSDDSIAYGYNSGEVDLSRYYEDTINVVQKDGQQYIEFKGTGMANFIEALYVDGKKMAIQKNDDNSYVAQVAYDKEVTETFNFTMIINAMGRIMPHSTEVELNVPDSAKTVTYTTDGSDISRNFKPEAILLEKNGKEYIQLQGTSMRQFIEYLYINGEKVDISGAINEGGAYLAQFELPKPLKDLTEEENKFTFDMVINARGTLMNHSTNITFDQNSAEDAESSNHSLITDTTTVNKSTIVESDDTETVTFETEGANISGSYEDTITIVKKDDKQYLQLHGKSMRPFVDALFIDGQRMNIGEATSEGGAYLAQYELPTSLAEKNTYDFTMLINARGNIMMHQTKLIIDSADQSLVDGEYLIDYDVLYEDEDKTSTASAYLVQPTKLEVKDDQKQLFIKLTDHETIKEFKIKQGEKYVSPEVVSTNEQANTRIIAFDIENLQDAIHAQVKVEIPGNYSSEQPFRIVLNPNTITDYDGSLEKEEEPIEFEDGHYTINFRTLDAEDFEKVEVGKLLNPPANIELKDGKRIVTLTIDNEVESFEIEQDDKFEAPKVVAEDEKAGTRDVQFEITEHNEIVLAKMMVANEKQRSGATEHMVRLYFEGNSMKPVEKEEEPAEKVELVAEKATEVPYKVLHATNDSLSETNKRLSGKAIVLEYEGKQYVQIETKDNNAQYITWLKSQLGDEFVDMVVVAEEDGERSYQFLLDKSLNEEVLINMFIDVDGVYEAEHEARIVFDPEKATEANPEDYTLVASTNENGPDGDGAQTPGDDEDTPGKDENDDEPGKDEDNDKPGKDENDDKPGKDEDNNTPGKDEDDKDTPEEIEAYSINYSILQAGKDEVSIANRYFSGKATLIDYDENTYVQISTKDQSGKFITWLQNKINGKYEDMLVVKDKNGDKTYQFKFNGPLSDVVALKMFIDVPGVYKEKHDARLAFSTPSLEEIDAEKVTLYKDESGVQGPKDVGVDIDDENNNGQGGQGSTSNGGKDSDDEKKNGKDNDETKTNIKPEKAFAIDYVIKQENADEVSIANDYFTGEAVLLEKGKDKYAHITTKDGSAKFIDALRSQLNGKFVDMAIVAKNGDDITYQFKLDGAVSAATLLDMVITVPGIYENQDHKARLFFDEKSMKEIDPAGYEIVGEGGKGSSLGKPSFGKGADGSGKGTSSGKEANPKTNDVTMILFYSLLLVGAGLVLFFQFRRKFAKQ